MTLHELIALCKRHGCAIHLHVNPAREQDSIEFVGVWPHLYVPGAFREPLEGLFNRASQQLIAEITEQGRDL